MKLVFQFLKDTTIDKAAKKRLHETQNNCEIYFS
jgi:hypothetical protein